MSALRPVLRAMSASDAPVAWLCKGVERAQDTGAYGLLGHEVCAQELPNRPSGMLSGPSFAAEVAAGLPTALVAGSLDAHLRGLLVEAFHGPSLRVYAQDDVVGIEVGGAVKNVLAIATGLCDGLGLGLNARAALITRGLAEMTRFGVALGAQPETFMGLSGLGDLVLTATGGLSRNRRVGLLLAEGRSAAEAVSSLGHVAEGVYCAYTVLRRAEVLGVDMPITRAVVDVIQGQTDARAAAASLMDREPVPESRPPN
jgi:glycerol-3-phosphate dehydrogenase (NAD(P)+)